MTHRSAPPRHPRHQTSPRGALAWAVPLLAVAAVALLLLGRIPAEGSGHGPGAAGPGDPGGDRAARSGKPSGLELPPRYLRLIRVEMLEIESAMQEELGHLARGEPRRGAEVARQIHQSFVLKRRLSEEERQELASLLPERFLSLDREFHGRAERLAEAFEREDFTAAAELYAEMTRACVRCHGRFATDRFPALGGEPEGDEESPQPPPER